MTDEYDTSKVGVFLIGITMICVLLLLLLYFEREEDRWELFCKEKGYEYNDGEIHSCLRINEGSVEMIYFKEVNGTWYPVKGIGNG